MATFADRFPLGVIGDVPGTYSNVRRAIHYSPMGRQWCFVNNVWVCGLFIFLHENATDCTSSSVGSLRIPMAQWLILLKLH